LVIVPANSALRLKAILDFTDLVKVEEKKVEEKKSMLEMNGYLKDHVHIYHAQRLLLMNKLKQLF
jgi:fatty acid-binding protein DegV